ncbi:MAG TPA: hypothetical protein VF718_12945 [Allosphingosinicella sp.]|jgi:hypothetical protein
MVRILLSFAAALAACTPSPQESAMHSPSPDPGTTEGSSGSGAGRGAAAEPSPEPASAAGNSSPAAPADSPAEAEGRRTLSTAFVMVGPDGRLVVELRDGRMLVLRDVVMRRKDYCGVLIDGGPAGARYCGGYGEVAAARPGAAESPT